MRTVPLIASNLRIAVLATLLCLWTGLLARSAPAGQIAPQCSPTPSFEKAPDELPTDVCNGSAAQKEQDFDTLAWQTFKFLVWPGHKTRRGEPDKQKKITDIDGDVPRTFETLKADWETFLPGGARPVRWNSYPRLARPCKNHPKIKKGALVLAAYSEFGNLLELVSPYTEVANLLVAQNSTYVRYLAAYNERVYAKIRNRRLYDVQTPIQSVGNEEAVPAATNERAGALTVKSSWIVLRQAGDPLLGHIEPSHFYTSEAWVQNPTTKTCNQKRVALVGLHFVHKTDSRPQWIWTTFEQVDNVPDPDSPSPPGKTYTFNNGNLSQHMGIAPGPDYVLPLPPGNPGPKDPPTPYQVERLQHLQEVTNRINLRWRRELKNLGSVWQYYQLVVTQWPTTPASPKLDAKNANPMPSCAIQGQHSFATANTTMETFLQGKPLHCDPRTTCMGCHGGARETDFVWSIPMNYHSRSRERRIPPRRAVALKTLKEIVQQAESR